MAILGLPMDVIGGACAGASCSFFTLFELDSNSTLAKALFSSRIKGVVTSTVGSLLIGILVNPLAGITFELFYYPACWLKVKRVEKALKRLSKNLKPGETAEVKFNGQWHAVKKLGIVNAIT